MSSRYSTIALDSDRRNDPCSSNGTRDVTDFARRMPEIRARVALADAGAAPTTEAEQYRLFEAVRSWLRATASERPVVLVIDDAHWADRPTLTLLGHVLRSAEPADLWAATGDSLRFPDGTLIPMRVGALRALDSVAVIVVQYGDDSGGSYIVRCKYPSLEIVIGNDWPSFADSGVVPLSRASVRDTTSVWRVLIELGRVDAVVTRACAQARAT